MTTPAGRFPDTGRDDRYSTAELNAEIDPDQTETGRCRFIGSLSEECGERYDTADIRHGSGPGQHFPALASGWIPSLWVDAEGVSHQDAIARVLLTPEGGSK